MRVNNRLINSRIIRFARFSALRIAATAAALDALQPPHAVLALRFAPDELYLLPETTGTGATMKSEISALQTQITAPLLALDEDAIIVRETGFSGLWLQHDEALDLLQRHCEWEPPTTRPAFAQGAVAGIPTKLWFTPERVLLLVATPHAQEMEERLQ